MTDAPRLPYAHAEQMRDHWWWRPGWRAGRRFYTWHLTFDDHHGHRGLRRLIASYQAALDGYAGLDLIPTAWLHLTVQGVGFTDEVDEDDLRRITDAAHARLAALPPLRVSFGPVLVSSEAIILPAVPPDPVAHIREALRAAIADVWGEDNVPEPADRFRPHVSLAYANRDHPSARAIAALEALRPEPVTVAVEAASLIVLDRDARMYRWRTHASVPIGHGQQPSA